MKESPNGVGELVGDFVRVAGGPGKINLGNAMRTFDKKREEEAETPHYVKRTTRREGAPKREPKTFFSRREACAARGSRGLYARLYWAFHAWPPFCGYAHDARRTTKMKKSPPQLRPFFWGDGRRAQVPFNQRPNVCLLTMYTCRLAYL